jgi:translation initiation factor IF-1
MVKRNTTGGSGYKKHKGSKKNIYIPIKPTDYYGMVLKLLGGNRILVKLYDGTEAEAIIPGKFLKSLWLKIDDHVRLNDGEVVGKVDGIDKIELKDTIKMDNTHDKLFENEYSTDEEDNLFENTTNSNKKQQKTQNNKIELDNDNSKLDINIDDI